MASRRKSAKPTNKLRQIHIENDDDDNDDNPIDDDDDENCGDRIIKAAFAPLPIPIEDNFTQTIKIANGPVMQTSQMECLVPVQTHRLQQQQQQQRQQQQQQQQQQHLVHSTVLLSQPSDDQAVSSSQSIEEPLLALPSDVYNDFEALRSATKLDSPALMRRLLKYYNKLTTSTVDRERKLDNVIEGIRGRCTTTVKEITSSSSSNDNISMNNNLNNITNSAAVLDLSVHSKTFTDQSSTSANLSSDIIHDLDDPECSPRPLDLTLQKENSIGVASLIEGNKTVDGPKVMRGSTSTLFSTCFQTPSASNPCVYSSSMDTPQAAPYVINLEPLTSTIQLSEPISQKDNIEQRNEIFLSQAYDSKRPLIVGDKSTIERPLIQSQVPQNSLITKILAGSQLANPSLIPHKTPIPKPDPKPAPYPPSALFPMRDTPLPSYKEAVSSSLFAKNNVNSIDTNTTVVNSNRNIVISDDKNNNNFTSKRINLDIASHVMNSEGRQISVLQLSPDFRSAKSSQSLSSNTPENFLLEPANQNWSPSQEITQASNYVVIDSRSNHSKTISTSTVSSHQECETFGRRAVGLPISINVENNLQRIQLPDLPENTQRSSPPSVIVSDNAFHTILPASTQTSLSGHPQTTVSLQSLLMSQSSDGTVSNVLAIPVLPGLPEGYTTLQHFTFEPAVPLPAKSEIQNGPETTAALPPHPIIVSAPIASTPNTHFSPKASPMINPSEPTTAILSNSRTSPHVPTSIESSKEWVKLKPGRPKGRTGKINSPRKTQNKGMKLLTEHSIFPGVYTSILKLPWSKRTRTKSKAKLEDDLKMKHQHFEENSTDNGDVEIQENSFVADSSYIPPELIVNMKESMGEAPQNTIPESDSEHILRVNRHPISLDQQQHQQFPPQYQIHLNGDHHRTTNEQTESARNSQSPCLSPIVTPQANNSFSDNLNHAVLNIKKETCDPSEIACSEIRHNVMLSSASIANGHDQPNISNSQDPIMLIYPNIGPNGSKSKKRRGRPPKKPLVETKSHQESFLFPVDSLFQSPDSMTEPSFLQGNNSSLTFIPNVSTPLSQEFTLMSPTSLASSFAAMDKTAGNTLKVTQNSLDFPVSNRDNDETSLENRIIFLTNQIEKEMARGVNPQPKDNPPVSAIVNKSIEQLTVPGQNKEMPPTPVEQSDDKCIPVVKQRRKKTSRLLKSNENFVYATFRFKPRGGSGAKRSKRKRKAGTTSMGANAETIANLRNKKLKCVDTSGHRSDSDTTRNEMNNVQTWKFHEQYPSESRLARSPIPILTLTSCSLCGGPVRKRDDVPSSSIVCPACSNATAAYDKEDDVEIINPHYDHDDVDDSSGEEEDGESCGSCISCGIKVEGHLDSNSQCDNCRGNTQPFIGPSKLFSIPNSSHQTPNSYPISKLSSPISYPDAVSEDTVRLASSMSTDGVLFCSLCRMQFTKISDYLVHLKETHESTQPPRTSPSLLKPDEAVMEISKAATDLVPRRMKSAFKTKKSLSHKTITCPVEDCPLFFRHQRDMDDHLRKVHLANSLNSLHEDGVSPHNEDIPVVQRIVPNVKDVDKCASMHFGEQHLDDFNNQLNSITHVAISPVESGDARQSQEKPLQCSFCNFRCRQKNAMTWHMRKHPEAASQHRCYSNNNTSTD